jgi:transposase-like protein
MHIVSVNREVNPPGETRRLTHEQVWKGLVLKAEYAVPFVPAIESCEILDRWAGGLVREVSIGGRKRQERITFTEPDKVRFDRVDSAEWSTYVISQTNRGLLLTVSRGVVAQVEAPDSPEGKQRGEIELADAMQALADTLATIRRILGGELSAHGGPGWCQPMEDHADAPGSESDRSARLTEDSGTDSIGSASRREVACYAKLVALLHPNGLVCPRCSASDRLGIHRRHRGSVVDYQCGRCRRVFNAWTGTVFQGMHRTPAQILQILRGIADGIPTARLARFVSCDRKHLRELRQRLEQRAPSLLDPGLLADTRIEEEETAPKSDDESQLGERGPDRC